MCQELSESCVLVHLTFHLLHSMQHSERCKVRSESVVSVTIQRMSQVFHLQLVSATATFVAHVVDQILLHMLGAEQMCRGVEDVRICISESQ